MRSPYPSFLTLEVTLHSHADLGTAFTVRYEESNIRDIQALIIGPPGTPYELGFYEVRATLSKTDPSSLL
jgi:Ubiquitin-protein ligase